MAVIEQAGRIVAFANLWPGPRKVELSVDLMRFDHQAPKDVMEALFVHLLLWGKEQGYRWFALGMAPLSGFETSPVAPLWNRLAAFLYEHGEAVYNFQGLRAYKEKFDPVWEPRYLAYPGGLRLPRILADVSALVAGGYRRILPQMKSWMCALAASLALLDGVPAATQARRWQSHRSGRSRSTRRRAPRARWCCSCPATAAGTLASSRWPSACGTSAPSSSASTSGRS